MKLSDFSLPIDEPVQTSQDVSPGTHGIWQVPFDEHLFGVLIDASTLQRYKKRRLGLVPEGLPLPATEWTSIEKYENITYIEKGNVICDYHFVNKTFIYSF